MKSAILINLFLLIELYWNSMAYAQWVTHHQSVPQPTISKPSLGAYTKDPSFGTTLIRISNARALGYAGVVPQYSRRQAWNADASRLLLFTGDGRTLLYDGSTYQFMQELDAVGGEDVFWHPNEPSTLIFAQDNTLFVYDLQTNSIRTLHTFPEYSFINTRGEGNISRDGKYYAFVGQVYDEQAEMTFFKDIVVYDLLADSIVAKLELPSTLTDFDWVSISPLGNYVVVDYATSNKGRFEGVEVYDRNLNFLWQKPLGAGHSDLGIDANSEEVLVIIYYDDETNNNIVKKCRLANGDETSLLTLSWQFDGHISCQNLARSGWCFVSTFDSEARLTDDSLSWLPFEDEIFAVKMDGSGEVQRIAHHHSRRFSPNTPDRDNSNYWAEPHATVSRDGGRILFGSNWREDLQYGFSVDSYIVDFRNLLSVSESEKQVSERVELAQNYPNPFSSTTTILFSLPQREYVTLKVFDVLGREIATLVDGELNAGEHTAVFDARDLPAGVYFYELRTTNLRIAKMMVKAK